MSRKKDYWQGPVDVLVPNYIDEVPCLDNINTMLKDGSCTELDGISIEPYTVESYREKFAEYKNGKWFWMVTHIYELDDPDWVSIIDHQLTGYWTGPFGILVPNYTPLVPGPNGGIYDKDLGPQYTNDGPITRDCEKAYKEKYAELDLDDNKWYWKNRITVMQ